MAKKLDNEVVTETVDVAAMKKQLDDVCGKVRRISDNWKVFAKKFIGKTDDGKMSGNVRVALSVFCLAMIATATYAASTIWQGYNGDAVKGTCKFVSDDAGATTLTVDKVVAASGITAPINGIVGGTTPAAGAFTTISASSTTTLTNVTVRPSAIVAFGASGSITNATIVGSTIGSVVPAAGAFTESTVDGKYSIVGTDATTGLMVSKGTFTNGQASVTFGATFGAAPVVICGWTTDVSGHGLDGTNCVISSTAITVSNFVPKINDLVAPGTYTNCNYIAVGTRP